MSRYHSYRRRDDRRTPSRDRHYRERRYRSYSPSHRRTRYDSEDSYSDSRYREPYDRRRVSYRERKRYRDDNDYSERDTPPRRRRDRSFRSHRDHRHSRRRRRDSSSYRSESRDRESYYKSRRNTVPEETTDRERDVKKESTREPEKGEITHSNDLSDKKGDRLSLPVPKAIEGGLELIPTTTREEKPTLSKSSRHSSKTRGRSLPPSTYESIQEQSEHLQKYFRWLQEGSRLASPPPDAKWNAMKRSNPVRASTNSNSVRAPSAVNMDILGTLSTGLSEFKLTTDRYTLLPADGNVVPTSTARRVELVKEEEKLALEDDDRIERVGAFRQHYGMGRIQVRPPWKLHSVLQDNCEHPLYLAWLDALPPLPSLKEQLEQSRKAVQESRTKKSTR